MIVAAHQPHYLPWLGYLDKIATADLFVVMDDLQYEAQNFQNRNRVKLNHGATWLTVPLERGAQGERICDKRIDNRGIAQGALAAPHLAHAATSTTGARRSGKLYAARAARTSTRGRGIALVELDLHMLALHLRWFEINTPVVRASSLALRGHEDRSARSLCLAVGADVYLSGSGGSRELPRRRAAGARRRRASRGRPSTHPRLSAALPVARLRARTWRRSISCSTAGPTRATSVARVDDDPNRARSVGGEPMTCLAHAGKATRVLAFGAHPDDLEVGAGGLLARLAQQGAEVMRGGGVDADADRRAHREARAARRCSAPSWRCLIDEKQCRVEDIPMHELVRADRHAGRRRAPRSRHHALGARSALGSRPGQSRDRLGAAPHAVRPAGVRVELRDERAGRARSIGQCFADITADHRARRSKRSRRTSRSWRKIDLESTRDLARAMGRFAGVRVRRGLRSACDSVSDGET